MAQEPEERFDEENLGCKKQMKEERERKEWRERKKKGSEMREKGKGKRGGTMSSCLK